MAINLDNKISSDDIQEMRDINNPPEYATGFEDSGSSGGGFDSLLSGFDDGDDFFGSGSSGGFGSDDSGGFGSSSSSGFDSAFGGGSSFGGGFDSGFGSGGFGSGGFGGGGFGSSNPWGSSFGGEQQNQQQQVEKKPDMMDKAMELSAISLKAIGRILVDFAKSIKTRNIDDVGYLGRNSIIVGGIMTASGVLSAIVGAITDLQFMKLGSLGGASLLSGLIVASSGLMMLGSAAFIIAKSEPKDVSEESYKALTTNDQTIDEVEEMDDWDDDSTEELSFASLFGTGDSDSDDSFNIDDIIGGNNNDDFSSSSMMNFSEAEPVEAEKIDYDSILDSVNENTYMTRETLYRAFKPMLPLSTPGFADVTVLDRDSKEFMKISTICYKVLSNLMNCEMSEVKSKLEKVSETILSYEIRLKRVKKVTDLYKLAREVEAYMRSSSKDLNVRATVDIEGDFYVIVVTKGESPIITLGDILTDSVNESFFLNTKNKLPIVTGIDSIGKVMLADAKAYDTMLIAGKPRSGKSWYVNSLKSAMLLFNSPDDIVAVFVDPKESTLFKTMALMPHVIGLHNDEKILEIMDEIINVEAPRRKKLLDTNRCDDIWALRNKGIKLPVMYLVIDEYLSVRNNLKKQGGGKDSELDTNLQTIISQLPSMGIRVLFVPHRATGVVDKTNRTMLQFTAAVKSTFEEIKDTLSITKWDTPLTMQGDIALKTSDMVDAEYVRGIAVTPSDEENVIFWETAAKVFYKMGVDVPDYRHLRICNNRDEKYVMDCLGGNGNRHQYDSAKLVDSLKAETYSGDTDSLEEYDFD